MRQHVSVRVRSLGWVCGVQERLCEGARDRGVQERPCEGAVRPRQPCASVPPYHFENLGKLGKNVWRSLAMQGLDPNRIITYVLGVLVLKKKGGVFLRGI